MEIQPYLFFDGRCEEALNFYRSALGAEITMLMRFSESPDPTPPDMLPPGAENKVMHAALKIGASVLLASDGHCAGNPRFEGMAISLTVASEAEAARVFAALSNAGEVTMPLGKTFFSPSFGMLRDRFGVAWMVYVAPA